MRISDWSSDVCSSDLRLLRRAGPERTADGRRGHAARPGRDRGKVLRAAGAPPACPAVAGGGGGQWRGGGGGRQPGVRGQIGRAAWRERVCQYVWIGVVVVALKKKTHKNTGQHL